jgi:hypothetical protein
MLHRRNPRLIQEKEMSDPDASPLAGIVDEIVKVGEAAASLFIPTDASPSSTEPAAATAQPAETPKSETTPEAAPVIQETAASPVDQINALPDSVFTTLDDAFQYIHEGFEKYSVMIGMTRLYEIARAIRSRVAQ